jgi:hypothetical protein
VAVLQIHVNDRKSVPVTITVAARGTRDTADMATYGNADYGSLRGVGT